MDSIEEENEEANINMGEAEEDSEGGDSVEEVEEEEEEVIRIERNLDYDCDDAIQTNIILPPVIKRTDLLNVLFFSITMHLRCVINQFLVISVKIYV